MENSWRKQKDGEVSEKVVHVGENWYSANALIVPPREISVSCIVCGKLCLLPIFRFQFAWTISSIWEVDILRCSLYYHSIVLTIFTVNSCLFAGIYARIQVYDEGFNSNRLGQY